MSRRAPLAILALAALAFTSCSATLRVGGTAPALDNAGTCASPVLATMPAGNLVTIHVQITGPAAREDSVRVVAGSPFLFAWSVPAGTYTVRAWPSDAGGAGCDTTTTATAKNPPWRVQL